MPKKLTKLAIAVTLAITALSISRTSSARTDDHKDLVDTITGKLEVVLECEGERSQLLYYLDTDLERIKLENVDDPGGKFQTGMQISAKGEKRADSLRLIESNKIAEQMNAPAIATNTFGEQNVLVLLVNFQNDTRQPFTIQQANDLVFNTSNATSVANYYREASYQQTWITGSTFGYFTLPINSGDCDGSTTASAARQAATNAGINLAAYNKFVYVYPNMSGCSYTGRGEIGGDELWINGSMYLRTLTHELGHTFGLYHARSMDCGAQVIGGTCTTNEYGNVADAMGYTGVTAQFDAFQKERLGWMNYGSSPPIATVQASGDYFITPNSAQDSGTKALKILRSNGTYYYVELRRLMGFDSTLSSLLVNGVVVTLNQPAAPRENYQLDMTPETTFWSDSSLAVGKSYTDSTGGFTITTVSVDNSGAVVNVAFGSAPPASCTLANPSISVTPATSQWISPGASVSYSVSVTNNNSSGCTSNTFNLQAALPSGWTWTSGTPSLSVASGASVSATIQVTSSAAAPNGVHTATFGVINAANAAYSTQDSSSINVFNNLAVGVATDRSSYGLTQTVTATANVAANGTPMPGANVVFTVTRPNGTTAATGSVVSSTNGTAVFTYKFNRKKDPIGVYRITSAATVGGVSGSGTVSFNLTK